MDHPLDRPLPEVARALRRAEISATELVEEAIRRHDARGGALRAYAMFDADGARRTAARADERLRAEGERAPPLCGVPVSVKDLYGVEGFPTFAGTSRRLPEEWARDGWLVSRLRDQGAVFVGKTHTVELAYGAVGINPNWDTPLNPWDAVVPRIPGGSSSGAGVSLHEGSALVALGSDTGGSIRIPSAMTGVVGHKTTKGRWPTDGVVPLSHTLDTVGALTRTVADSRYFFDAVDPARGGGSGPDDDEPGTRRLRVGIPGSSLWEDAQDDIVRVLETALHQLGNHGWERHEAPGDLLDAAGTLYFEGGIPGAECQAMLARELPGWREILDPIVARRLETVPPVSSGSYAAAVRERARMEAEAPRLFEGVDLLALPSNLLTPPTVAAVADLDRYVEVNHEALRPTCPIGMLGLCAVSLPVGLDDAGMPVGLQLVAPGGADGALLRWALAAERVLGAARERLGPPPALSPAAERP